MNGGRGRVGIGAMAAPIVCAVGLSLAACTTPPPTSTPTPSVVTSPRPTTTPSPTPTPTPDAAVKPERPAAMEEVNAAGAEAAAVYFMELFPYVYATGDLEEWRELSHPECVFCANVIAGVEEMIAADQHTDGGLIAVSAVLSTEKVLDQWFLVAYDLSEAPSSRVEAAGQVVEEYTAKDYRVEVAVSWEGSSWMVRELTHTLVD